MSPSPYQTNPSQWSLRSKLEWGSAHKEFYLAAPFCSCSGISSCALAQHHKHLDSGQGLYHFSRIPPHPRHHQASVTWVWTKSVACFIPWSLCASSHFPKPPAHTVRVKPCWSQFLQHGFVHVQALMNGPFPHFPVNKHGHSNVCINTNGFKPGWAGSLSA